jgi:hypothetical protein
VLHALCTVIICSELLDLYSSETYVTEFYISIQVYFASVFSRIFLLMELRDLKVLPTYLLETWNGDVSLKTERFNHLKKYSYFRHGKDIISIHLFSVCSPQNS